MTFASRTGRENVHFQKNLKNCNMPLTEASALPNADISRFQGKVVERSPFYRQDG
jgi:hypothetical protein